MESPTNQDLLSRIDEIEAKVDHLCVLVEQANGAWLLLKIAGSIIIGYAAVWSALHNWWQR